MWLQILEGILIPFIGTTLGAACVFLMGRKSQAAAVEGAAGSLVAEGLATEGAYENSGVLGGPKTKQALTGFASGIMVAASFFSLLIPAIEYSSSMGKLSFIPAAAGFLIGMLFMLVLDIVIPHMHTDSSEEGMKSGLSRSTKLVLAVTLHNIPEGMAVGVVFASWLYGNEHIEFAAALALALGIALQNFPEGAIVSMPLRAEGMSKQKTFLYGMMSGAVEPLGAIVMILAAGILVPVLPYLLAFAAGAMLYVVVEELIPEMSQTEHSNIGTVCFALGAAVMMCLDVGLG